MYRFSRHSCDKRKNCFARPTRAPIVYSDATQLVDV